MATAPTPLRDVARELEAADTPSFESPADGAPPPDGCLTSASCPRANGLHFSERRLDKEGKMVHVDALQGVHDGHVETLHSEAARRRTEDDRGCGAHAKEHFLGGRSLGGRSLGGRSLGIAVSNVHIHIRDRDPEASLGRKGSSLVEFLLMCSRKMAQEKKQIFQHEQKRVTTFYQEDDEDDDPQFELEVHSLTDVSHDPKPLENKEIKKKPSTWKRIRHFLGIRKPRRWKRLKEPAPSGSSHKDHSQRCEADRPTARPQPRNRELDKLQSLTRETPEEKESPTLSGTEGNRRDGRSGMSGVLLIVGAVVFVSGPERPHVSTCVRSVPARPDQ
ncbi:Hypothetical protein SMAX5B_016785 [Scophthalmus maximus]|uniref:Uncharacterized protein n=1 Tax=Scophthalmus maximus TaxID=52904 RepID=A0A2U9CDM1_SCOMX|nr:Hypothetical protein SMAX5B_016785 [Scophthalmus maximus]